MSSPITTKLTWPLDRQKGALLPLLGGGSLGFLGLLVLLVLLGLAVPVTLRRRRTRGWVQIRIPAASGAWAPTHRSTTSWRQPPGPWPGTGRKYATPGSGSRSGKAWPPGATLYHGFGPKNGWFSFPPDGVPYSGGLVEPLCLFHPTWVFGCYPVGWGKRSGPTT